MKTLLLASWEEMLLVNLDRESGGPWKGTAQAGAKGERSVSHQQRDKAPIEVSRIRGKGRSIEGPGGKLLVSVIQANLKLFTLTGNSCDGFQ